MLLRKLLLMVLISTTVSAMAQTNDYVKNWKKVEALEKKGLPNRQPTRLTLYIN